jgi:hypothetical protein
MTKYQALLLLKKQKGKCTQPIYVFCPDCPILGKCIPKTYLDTKKAIAEEWEFILQHRVKLINRLLPARKRKNAKRRGERKGRK